MSDDLIETLRRAQHAGSVAFELRDPADAIRPARRRVRRHKAVVGGATALSAVAVVGAAGWGIAQAPFGGSSGVAADEPAAGGAPTATDHSEEPVASDAPTPGSAAGKPLLVGDVIAAAEPRRQGDISDGRTPLLACDPADDPGPGHDYNVPGRSIALVSCDTLWSDGDVRLTVASDSTVGMDVVEGTVTARFTLVNDGTEAILYREAIYGVLETDAQDLTDDSGHLNGLALAERSAWEDDATRVAVLTSERDEAVLEPGERVTGTIVWRDQVGEGTALSRILGGEADFTVTFGVWVVSGDQGPVANVVDVPLIIEASDGLTYGLEREPS